MAQDIELGSGVTAGRGRFAERFRLPVAIAVFVLWLVITINPLGGPSPGNFLSALASAPQWSILCAGLFLLLVAGVCRWGDLGLNPPEVSLRILWLPGLYLLLFILLDLLPFLPQVAREANAQPLPASMVGILLLNSALAGFSEELMFRGVLFGALRTRLPLLGAIVVTTVLFGLVHLLNAIAIGDWRLAATQAVAAAMSGLLFIAIRLRTNSLLPGMIYHALWDASLLVLVSAYASGGGAGGAGVALPADTPPGLLAGPVILLLPNFIYALFLLRRRPVAAAA